MHTDKTFNYKFNIMKFFKWFSGFFEDQGASASSKRAVLFIMLFFLWDVKNQGYQLALQGKIMDRYILYSIILIILFCLGAITAEFFKDKTIKPE